MEGVRVIGQRINNATEDFIEITMERGFSKEESLQILAFYSRERIVKLDTGIGRYKFAHGAYVETDVMQRALDAEKERTCPA